MSLARRAATGLLALAAALPLPGLAQAVAKADCPPQPVPLDADRVAAGMRDARDHGFLWSIARDGRTSYLYGTIHAARPEWMFPGPRTVAALAASDTLALELDLLDAEVQARVASALKVRGATPLPPALAARLERRLVAECMDPAKWRSLAPEFQVTSLAVMAARREGLDPAYAVDLVLGLTARHLGKKTVSLETPEAQIAALVMPSRPATIALVDSSLDMLESGRARPLLLRMAAAWSGSDLAELEGYERWCDCLNTAAERAAMERLLDDRNPLLAAAIDALHAAGGSVFAATGSLHMVGPRGLPALLRERGYAVEAVRFDR
ncbi:MAG: TraB/GumN family protein [Caldimonas sp.]